MQCNDNTQPGKWHLETLLDNSRKRILALSGFSLTGLCDNLADPNAFVETYDSQQMPLFAVAVHLAPSSLYSIPAQPHKGLRVAMRSIRSNIYRRMTGCTGRGKGDTFGRRDSSSGNVATDFDDGRISLGIGTHHRGSKPVTGDLSPPLRSHRRS